MRTRRVGVLVVLLASLGGVAPAQDDEVPLRNWAAPPYWVPPGVTQTEREPGTMQASAQGMQAEAAGLPSQPLPFTAITPCRVADTRGNGFTGAYGPPSLLASSTRDFPIGGQCGIPANAAAVSFNFTVVNGTQNGDLRFYPTGGSMPLVSTINWKATTGALANAAIVPLGSSGSVTVKNDCIAAIDLIIDVNGYYGPSSVVTSLNALTGDLTLAAGSNVAITPGGNTLTIAMTGVPGGTLPSGTSGQTLYSNGSGWLASSALTNDGGANVGVNGNLNLPDTASAGSGVITFGGQPFVHNYAGPGSAGGNTFVGEGVGNFTMGCAPNCGSFPGYGSYNTAVGYQSLHSNTTGYWNTAGGIQSLYSNTTGAGNTASGLASLYANTAGAGNTASGGYSLIANTTGNANTAYGGSSLYSNTTGSYNTATGSNSLDNNSSGNENIAIGHNAGYNLTTGSYNIDIGNQGVATEANTIRIGDSHQTRTFIAGIRGVTTGNANAVAVMVDSLGQLGTVSSSIRVKQDVADVGEASGRLLELRPVAFHYKSQPDGPLQYGLIAEEVEQVMPELVVRDATGQVETVAYHELPALLLNEIKRQHATISAQQTEIDALKAQLAEQGRQLRMLVEVRLPGRDQEGDAGSCGRGPF